MLHLIKIKEIYCLIFIVGLYVIVNIIHNYTFMTESFLSQWYEGVFTRTQIQETLSFIKKWESVVIALNILLIFIKIACVAACLYLGLFFFSNQHHAYKTSFNIAIKAEIVFVVYSFVRLLWFSFVHLPESLEEMQIWPLSLMHFFDPATIEPWLIYPLNTINLFEIVYILLLSALTAAAIQIKFRKAFDLVFVSYGSGLLLLIVLQMFLILNNS